MVAWNASVANAQPVADGCGTQLSPEDAATLWRRHQDAPQLEDADIASGPTYVVPVSFHVVRRSNGSGGINESQLAAGLSLANSSFAGAGMSFCQVGPVHYVDSDFYYLQANTNADILELFTINRVPSTVNVYLLPFLTTESGALCGLATFSIQTNGGVAMRYSCIGTATQGTSFPHEIGHYFDLFHTHEGLQCTNGVGCESSGDLLCDTPPDPTLGTHNVIPGCTYTGTEPDPCGTMQPFVPLVNNFMSYSPGPCRNAFTPGQLARARSTLITQRPDHALSECPTGTGPSADLTRVSVSTVGAQSNGHSNRPSLNSDGRYVVFTSQATNLDPRDTSATADIYLHDRLLDTTELVSVSLGNTGGNDSSGFPTVSSDGRYVTFESAATNLTKEQTIGLKKIHLRDRQLQQTTLISVPFDGSPITNECVQPIMTPDARFIAFVGSMDNLVPGDTNNTRDVFVHDRQTGETSRVSISSSGQQANDSSPAQFDGRVSISADGRYVAFSSSATNLIPIDTNEFWGDVYLHDRTTGQTSVVSVSSAGEQADFGGENPVVSDDGRRIAFQSPAGNLSPDPNGFSPDVFMHDRATGQTIMVGLDANGQQPPFGSTCPSISGNGRRVAFERRAGSGGNPQNSDAIVRDLVSGEHFKINPSLDGLASTINTRFPVLSSGGNVAVYQSDAANLVLNDTNQRGDVFAFALPAAPLSPGDIDADGSVNVVDLLSVIAAWGPCQFKAPCPADIAPLGSGGNGVVNVEDLLLVIGSWGG